MMQDSVIRSDPCNYRPDPRTKSTDGKVSGYIHIHPRFFYDVTFQTGSTGWTGYDFDSGEVEE